MTRFNEADWYAIFPGGDRLGNMSGFGYTKHSDRNIFCGLNLLRKISDDIDPIELLINREARVHGFRCNSVFFLVWLDRDHLVFPLRRLIWNFSVTRFIATSPHTNLVRNINRSQIKEA